MSEDVAKKVAEKKKAVVDRAKQKNAHGDAAHTKADDDAKAMNATQEKGQEDLATHLTQTLFMLPQAGVKFLKERPQMGKNVKLVYIPGLDSESMDVLLQISPGISWQNATATMCPLPKTM